MGPLQTASSRPVWDIHPPRGGDVGDVPSLQRSGLLQATAVRDHRNRVTSGDPNTQWGWGWGPPCASVSAWILGVVLF